MDRKPNNNYIRLPSGFLTDTTLTSLTYNFSFFLPSVSLHGDFLLSSFDIDPWILLLFKHRRLPVVTRDTSVWTELDRRHILYVGSEHRNHTELPLNLPSGC